MPKSFNARFIDVLEAIEATKAIKRINDTVNLTWCQHCAKPIPRDAVHYIGVTAHDTRFYCSERCRTLAMNPPKEYLDLVKKQLGRLYLKTDIKHYHIGEDL